MAIGMVGCQGSLSEVSQCVGSLDGVSISHCKPSYMLCAWSSWSGFDAWPCPKDCQVVTTQRHRRLRVTRASEPSLFQCTGACFCNGIQVAVQGCDTCLRQREPKHCCFSDWSDWSA